MDKKNIVSVGDGFRLDLGFTLGSFAASFVILPVFACIGLIVITALGGSLASLLGQ